MNRILEQVQNGDFDPLKVFTGNKDKFLEVKTAIESISNNLPKETCIQFVLTKIIPTIFDITVDNTVRDEAVELGLHFLQFVDISHLTTKEQENVFQSIEDAYTKVIGDLRDKNYPNWDKLWIFLIKLCGESLHTKLTLANKLLRIVEVAFRNSTSIDQRLKAYDCWIELINNSSLKMEHMSSPKQIKLLVTPMKAKFSRTPVVIMKRCDTFVYLLEKLQEKATLCLKEFLEFCFGPFDEKNVEKMKQGRSVPDVCNKSTKVLLGILGHAHDETEICVKTDELKLYKPLIDETNFPNFAEVLISSVIECCVLMNEWSKDSSINNTIIKCLWRSLLGLIKHSNEEVIQKCCIQINVLLRNLLERSHCNEYLHTNLGDIIELLIDHEIGDKLKEILFDMGINLLCTMGADSCDMGKISNFVISCFDPDNSKFDKIGSTVFANDTKCVNSALCDVWLKCKLTVGPDVSNLLWPVRHFKNFEGVEALDTKWTNLYDTECKTDTKIVVMQEMEKLFLENPLLSSNVVHFLELICGAESNPSKDFVSKFMRLIESVLTLPNLSASDVKKMGSIVLTYFDENQNFCKSEGNDEALDKLCGCLEHIVTIHKEYTVLTKLINIFKKSQPIHLIKFSKRLIPFLEGLMLNEDNSVITDARKLIELLETKEIQPEPETPTSSATSTRSLRMVNMASVTSKVRKSSAYLNNLSHFNKRIEKSPLSLKTYSKTASSPRGKAIIDNMKKKDNVVSLIDDKSSDYVPIESEVKINPRNLSEHQKEMFKKRREDIPALYQDLTQSQSQDFFKINSEDSSTEHSNHLSVTEPPNKRSSPRKRKREENDDSEQVTKARRISETVSVKKKLEELDDEIEADTPDLIKEDTTHQQNGIEKVDEISEESKVETDESRDHVAENHTEGKTPEKKEEVVTDKPRTKSSEKKNKEVNSGRKVRKSKRKTVYKMREDLVNAVKKQLDKSAEKAQLEESLIEDSFENISTEIEPEENDKSGIEIVQKDNDKSSSEVEATAENNIVETDENTQGLRKSKRQIKRRQSLEIKGKSSETNGNDDSKKELREKPEKPNTNLENSPHKKKKKVKEYKKITEDEEVANLSNEALLAIIDKRIEDNKKLEMQLELEDGNQNKIIALPAEEDHNLTKLKDNRIFAKAKRHINPSIKPVPVINTSDKVDEAELSSRKPDVYEFKAEDDGQAGEIKTRRKKKKKMSFDRNGYSKRKKKPKKNTKDVGLAFHITADSPLPLSESPTLKAVPSQENETITLVIRRSLEIDDSNTASTTEKDRKSPEIPSSEDIIESSQVTPVNDTSKRKSSPSKNRSRSFKQTTLHEVINRRSTRTLANAEEAEPETIEVTEDVLEEKDNELNEVTVRPLCVRPRRLSLTELSSGKVGLGQRHKRSKSLDKLDFTTQQVTFLIKPKTPENEEPVVHGNETSMETLTCESVAPDTDETIITDVEMLQHADTLTLSPINSETKEELPSSPITCDTPDRKTELLNNTVDISPISSQEEPDVTTPKQSTNEVTNVRVARLLQMVNSNVQVSNDGRRWFGHKHFSPSTSKVRKMRLKKEENLDVLTFSREIPSPLTVPASGILKRKFNLEEAATPSPKRKRVNFSDPAITEKKIFIKDSEEFEENGDSTNVFDFDLSDEGADKQSNEFLNGVDKEDALLHFKDFCDSNFKNAPPDSSAVKNALKYLIQNLKVPEIVEVVAEYLRDVDSGTVDEITDGEASEQVIDKCVVPLIEKMDAFDKFLPKLISVVEKLPDDHLSQFIKQIKVFGKNKSDVLEDTKWTQERVKEHVLKYDCDKMSDLMREYFYNLPDQQRNDFLLNFMRFASSELPVKKEFIKCHIDILNNFVSKMTD